MNERRTSILRCFIKNLASRFQPAIPSLKKLCVVCGCFAKHACSRCKAVNYCSAAHQRAHWKQHKPQCGSVKTTDASTPVPEIVFPEYELVMERDPTGGQTETAEKDENECLAEYENLAASGKTGELSDVSEKELDKYFGDATATEDKVFHKFKKVISAEPKQIIRYQRGGDPLWITSVADAVERKLQALSGCTHCGGPRKFEFQIMPQMLVQLKDDCLDWGVLAVYTCASSCQISGYVEEHVIKQDIVASPDV